MLPIALRGLRRHAAWLAFPFFAALVFGTQWFIVPLPYHWDEAVVYYNPLHELITEGIRALADPGFFLYHPPGMQLLAWPFYWIFGDQPATGRILSGLMASLGLYFTFLIGRRHSHWLLGLLASLLLLSSVRFFPQALQFHADIFLFGLGAAYVYAGLSGRFALALWLGLACGLVRESALALGLGLGVFYCVEKCSGSRWWKASVAAAPFATVGCTFVFHYFLTGRFFNHEALTSGDIGLPAAPYSSFGRVLTDLASGWFCFLPQVGHGGAEIYLGLFLAAFFLVKRAFSGKAGVAAEWAFASVSFLFLAFFSFHAGFLPRYLLPAYPFFLLFVLGLGWRLSRWITGLLVIAAIVTNPRYHHEIGAAHSSHRSGGLEYSMGYPEMIRLHQEMAVYLDATVPRGSTIQTGWPFTYIFLHPKFGYVKNERIGSAERADYIIDGSCLPEGERAKFKDKLALFSKVHEISRSGIWVALYKNQ